MKYQIDGYIESMDRTFQSRDMELTHCENEIEQITKNKIVILYTIEYAKERSLNLKILEMIKIVKKFKRSINTL